jgi:hypothetical protein
VFIGSILIFYFGMICSQNTALKTLILGDLLGGNQIEDNGAMALADALTYLTIMSPANSLEFVFVYSASVK